MKINLQGKNMEITPAIHNYVMKRVTNLGKLLDKLEQTTGEIFINFNVAKTTNHHKSGEVFRADCSIKTMRGDYFSSVDEEDLYAAIDAVKENIFREISKDKDRKQALFKRGAISVKKMMKGLSKRNPFTSKY